MVYGHALTTAEIDQNMNVQAAVQALYVSPTFSPWASNTATFASNTSVWASNDTSNLLTQATFASNTALWASNTALWASNDTSNLLTQATFASNTALWTSNSAQRVYASAVTPLNATWFTQPIYSKSYSVTNYVTDSVIDASLKPSTYTVVSVAGSAMFSNTTVPLPANHLTSFAGFYITPYSSNNGLSASFVNTLAVLDRLDLTVNYVASPYNTV